MAKRRKPHRTGLLVSNPKLKVFNAQSGKIAAAGYNNSDRLGIALCLVGVVGATVLFLIEKTSTTVPLLLALMVAALVYPVLHFCRTPRSRIVIFVILAIGVFAFGRFVWPNKSALAPVPDSDKLNEIVNLIKNQDEQQKFLSQYPLGYTIFQLDSVTGAMTPYQARQGLEAYEFNFKTAGIVENTATRISIQLPEVLKDGKPLFKNATIGGDKKSMEEYGAGYIFSDGPIGVLGSGRVLQYDGNRVIWIFGLRRISPPLPPPQH
jgi:hypothetical protein